MSGNIHIILFKKSTFLLLRKGKRSSQCKDVVFLLFPKSYFLTVFFGTKRCRRRDNEANYFVVSFSSFERIFILSLRGLMLPFPTVICSHLHCILSNSSRWKKNVVSAFEDFYLSRKEKMKG